MLVGGWYDTEDPQGLLRQFDFMEKNTPPAVDMLVMGPWNHGGFARGDGDRLGNVNFGSKTGLYYRRAHRISVLPVLPEGPRRRQSFPRRGCSRPA
jgi:predicted acyl esterase